MTDERHDGFMMIGLHKLASQNGDGLVPELYDLLLREQRRRLDHPNVAEFPMWNARPPGAPPEADPGSDALDGKNVVAFAGNSDEKETRKKQR